jgi:hypothetical protein
VLNLLARYFGKRGSKAIACLILMAYGLKNQEIKDKFGMSHDSPRKRRAALEAKNVEPLFTKGGPREKSALEQYDDKITSEFEANPPQTLRDAQERIFRLTGIKRSLNRIRVRLLKRGSAAGP